MGQLDVDPSKATVTPTFSTQVTYKLQGTVSPAQQTELKKQLAATFGVPEDQITLEIVQNRRLQEHGEGHLRNLQAGTSTAKVTVETDDPDAAGTIATKAGDTSAVQGALASANIISPVEITEAPATTVEMKVALIDNIDPSTIDMDKINEVCRAAGMEEMEAIQVDQADEEAEEDKSSAPQGGLAFAVAVTACIAAVVATEGL